MMKSHADKAIEEFVRGQLGCNCPAKVFDLIDVVDNPVEFENLPANQLIKIGGILLVLVLQVEVWEPLQSNLESMFKRGIEMRDARRFNRFRLVVATPDADKARRSLEKHFETFSGIDEKIHLHVVTPGQLPHITAS